MAETKKVLTEDGMDVTEGVQILYEIAHASMDWGSGFLDNAEMETIIRLAILMNMQVPNLPSNSPAMITVAKKFPEHYDIALREIPEITNPRTGYTIPARNYVDITVKDQRHD